jgi:hypothetical protein
MRHDLQLVVKIATINFNKELVKKSINSIKIEPILYL